MSGHSKWHSIKHKKGAADQKRGKLFGKLVKQVEVAARAGGGDLEGNATLRTMYQKARDASVPIENIERAIKRGTGELEGVNYEQVTYEAYAPSGVALYIEVLTDNRNRSSSDIRTALTRNGGSLAEPGSVAWQFERTGIVLVPGSTDEDLLMEAALENGAADIVDEGELWRITCDPSITPDLRVALEASDIVVESADVVMLATQTVPILDLDDAKAIMRVMDALDDVDDVQDVHANFDIPDEILEAAAAGA